MIIFAEELTNPFWLTTLISLLSLLGGGVGAWLISVYQAKKKEAREDKDQDLKIRTTENEQAFQLYKEIVNRLKEDVTTLNIHVRKLEEEHIHCREDKIKLETEIVMLKKEVDFLNRQVVVRTELPVKTNDNAKQSTDSL